MERPEKALGNQKEQTGGVICGGRSKQGAGPSRARRPGRSQKEAGGGPLELWAGCSFQTPEANGVSSWVGWRSEGTLTAATSVEVPFEPHWVTYQTTRLCPPETRTKGRFLCLKRTSRLKLALWVPHFSPGPSHLALKPGHKQL